MGEPVRIQRKRTAEWRMPPNTVYVGRPSKWGNPYTVGDVTYINSGRTKIKMDAALAVSRFRERAVPSLDSAEIIRELRGKNLACWCRLDQPCHADVLLKIANRVCEPA